MRTPRCCRPLVGAAAAVFMPLIVAAVELPYVETFETAELGLTRSPYNGLAGSGVNENALPENPPGWIDGPPVSAASSASPWSIAEVAGNRYLRLHGPERFDGNGLAYASFNATHVPVGDGRGWEASVEFTLDELTLNGANSTLGLGLGAGARRLFTNVSGGGNYGRDEGYFVEIYFEASSAADLAAVPPRLRILRSTGSPALAGSSVAGPAGFLDRTSTYRLTLRGVGEGTARRVSGTVENLTVPGSPLTLEYLDEAPVAVNVFGLRHRSASYANTANHLLALDVRFDNFAVALVGVSALQNWRQAHFGTTAGTGDAADAADPDGDGVPNAWEYALGRNPLKPGAPGPLFTGAYDPLADTFTATVRVRAHDPDLTLALERAPSPGGPWTEVTSTPTATTADTPGFERRHYSDPAPDGTVQFYRFAIEERP